jgi:hypothetical protein
MFSGPVIRFVIHLLFSWNQNEGLLGCESGVLPDWLAASKYIDSQQNLKPER